MANLSNTSRPFGFNVISYVSANLGFGVTARNVVQLLLDRGYPVAILDIDPNLGRTKLDLTFQNKTVERADDLPYSINLVILFAPDLPDLILLDQPCRLPAGCLNVAWFIWELTVLPALWVKALENFDVVVAQTPFIRATLENELSDTFIIPALHPIFIPDKLENMRNRFGIPENQSVFITSFEPHSDPARKNPEAAIRAFLAAFGPGDGAMLLIKLNNATNTGLINPTSTIERLKRLASGAPHVRFLAENLSYRDVLSLYNSCDVYISMHRAEGLGLGPLEAMALGKPVIATSWSGNMGYMDFTNSCPVRYRLVDVNGSIPTYQTEFLGKQAQWAEPYIEDASAWMKKLHANPPLRSQIGSRASATVRALHDRATEGHFIDELLDIWQSWRDFLPDHQAIKANARVQLHRAANLHYATPLRKKLLKSKDWLDKRFLWRFNSAG